MTSFIAATNAVATGGAETRALDAESMRQIAALVGGTASVFIPLNGGSETRREVREYWVEWATGLGIAVKACGWGVWLGSGVAE